MDLVSYTQASEEIFLQHHAARSLLQAHSEAAIGAR